MIVDGAELRRVWREAAPAANSEYTLCSSHAPWFIGCSKEGRPALIRQLSRRPGDSNRVIGAVRVRLLAGVALDVQGAKCTTDIAALECLDDALIETFVVLVMDVIREIGDGDATGKDVLARVGEWRELLTDQRVLDVTDQLGLWGELEILSRFPDPEAAADGWYGPDREAIDFSRNLIGIEVKTSTHRRVHVLRWSQAVFGQTDHDAYLVSLHVQRDSAGTSLPEQVEHVAAMVSDRYQFREKLLKARYREDQAANYDARWILVEEPVAFPIKDVPGFVSIPESVFDVRWRVDLSAKKPLSSSAFEKLLRLFVG